MMAGTAALRFSRWVMRRARARRSPPSRRSTSAAGSARRGVASDPAIGERPDSNMPAGDARGGRASALPDHSEARLERRGPSPATFCGSITLRLASNGGAPAPRRSAARSLLGSPPNAGAPPPPPLRAPPPPPLGAPKPRRPQPGGVLGPLGKGRDGEDNRLNP